MDEIHRLFVFALFIYLEFYAARTSKETGTKCITIHDIRKFRVFDLFNNRNSLGDFE